MTRTCERTQRSFHQYPKEKRKKKTNIGEIVG